MESRHFTAIVDDDPTGIQTVHGVSVYMDHSAETLLRAAREGGLFFIQTNSRGMAEERAAETNRLIMERLVAAAREAGADFTVISRSDSTLRGHYPAETEALREAYERLTGNRMDGELLIPFFLEGGRFTIGDVHYVREGGALVPAARTEFARDRAFAYASSNLREYVQEKHRGQVLADDVLSVSLEDLRGGGDEAYRKLMELSDFRRMVVNAETYGDLDALVAALRRAEGAGRRFLYRTAASFVRAYGAITPRPLLTAAEMFGKSPAGPGLVVAGSHVRKTTEQLGRLFCLWRADPVEASVPALLAGGGGAEAEIARCASAADGSLARGRLPVVYTSRAVAAARGAEASLSLSAAVSLGLVNIVRGMRRRPAFIIAKGGITSSDVAVKALGIQKAEALGQILPGVPVLRCGPESRWPGMPYVVFPGNVGGEDDLWAAAAALLGEEAAP